MQNTGNISVKNNNRRNTPSSLKFVDLKYDLNCFSIDFNKVFKQTDFRSIFYNFAYIQASKEAWSVLFKSSSLSRQPLPKSRAIVLGLAVPSYCATEIDLFFSSISRGIIVGPFSIVQEEEDNNP